MLNYIPAPAVHTLIHTLSLNVISDSMSSIYITYNSPTSFPTARPENTHIIYVNFNTVVRIPALFLMNCIFSDYFLNFYTLY